MKNLWNVYKTEEEAKQAVKYLLEYGYSVGCKVYVDDSGYDYAL